MEHTPWRTWGARMRQLTLSLFLVFMASGFAAFGQKKAAKSGTIPVSVHQFALQQDRDSFSLQPLPVSRQHPRIPIPKEWLVPQQDNTDEDEGPVNPYRYDGQVTSFPIGNGEIGLRFSSFGATTEEIGREGHEGQREQKGEVAPRQPLAVAPHGAQDAVVDQPKLRDDEEGDEVAAQLREVDVEGAPERRRRCR